MKYKKLGSAIGVVTLAFGLSGLANSECYIGPETNATSVQSDSGNGNYECTLFTTPDGTLKEEFYYPSRTNSNYKVTFEDGTLTWSAETDVFDGKPYDVDLVSVARNSGKRCNYTYPDQQVSGTGLTTSDGGTPLYVTICADGMKEAVPPPPPPEPISTADQKCTATFDADGDANTPDEEFDVTFGYSKQYFEDGVEGAAICTKGGVGQRQCVNECVPVDIPEGTDCTADVNGELPLACASCELEFSEDLKYCWYWENRVCEFGDEAPYCNENARGSDTFIPSPKKKSLHAQVDVTTGSDCYTVTIGPLYGGYTYSYQYCPPSP